MLRDDALLAFERHATSKLHDVKDLDRDRDARLPRRGAAFDRHRSRGWCSKRDRRTRPPERESKSPEERFCDATRSPPSPGTVITVRDLFFNVPARKKFLRSEQTELAHIASLVTHYSLAHPDKTFELLNGAAGAAPRDACRDVARACLSGVRQPDAGGSHRSRREARDEVAEAEEPVRVYTLTGFVSRPQVQKNNRNSIYIFVNGRLIRDRLLMHAIGSAYHNLIPPACYPFALLFLSCDPAEVDVNVHPSKTEVRFRHGSIVHDFVRDAIRERLMETRPAPSFPPSPQPAADAALFGVLADAGAGDAQADARRARRRSPCIPNRVLRRGSISAMSFRRNRRRLRPVCGCASPIHMGRFPTAPLRHRSSSLADLSDLRPLGQIHDSFIIAAGRDGLWIIDQHVAHERILFEKVLKQRAAGRVEQQRLLMPLILQLTQGQQIEYARIADELNATGFETEPFGQRTIAVKAAPAAIGSADLERVIYEILEIAEQELRKVSIDDLRRGIAASLACRAAIKINTRLDQNKMNWLIASPGRDGVSHVLPAWPADRAALSHARYSEGISSHLNAG